MSLKFKKLNRDEAIAFKDPIRLNGREELYQELLECINRYRQLTDYDVLHTLRLLSHIVSEGKREES